jgi:hypothetical protein
VSRTPDREEIEARNAQVRHAIDGVPFDIGAGWVGEDVPVPADAQEVLGANAIFSRMYTLAGSEWIHLKVIHCSDSRDMAGHWPPNCYERPGWKLENSVSDLDFKVPIGDHRLPMRAHYFSPGPNNPDGPVDIRVLCTFILPDGTMSPEIGILSSLEVRFNSAAEGVAQLQLVTSGTMSDERAIAAASEILDGAIPLLHVLGFGENSDQ